MYNSVHREKKRSIGDTIKIKKSLKNRQKISVITQSNSKGNYFLANSFLFKKKKHGKLKNFITQGNANDSLAMNTAKKGISMFPNSKAFENTPSNTINFSLKKQKGSPSINRSQLVKDLIKNQKSDGYKSGIVIPKMRRRKSRNKITFKRKEGSAAKGRESNKILKKNLKIERPGESHIKPPPPRMYTPSMGNNVFANIESKKLIQTSGKFYGKSNERKDVTPKSRASRNFSKVAENILNKDKSNPTIDNDSRNSQNYAKLSSVDRNSNHGSNSRNYMDSKKTEEYYGDGAINTVDLNKRTKRPDVKRRMSRERRKQKEESNKMRKSYFEQFKSAQERNEEARQESKKEAQRRRDELQNKVEKLRAFRKAQAEEEREKKRKMVNKIKEIHKERDEEKKRLKEETTKPEVSSSVPSTMIKWTSDTWPNLEEELFFGKCIGEGSFAKVYEGFDKVLKKWVAIKIIKKKHFIRKNKQYLIQNEVDIIADLTHKNIIKFDRLVEDHKRVSIPYNRKGIHRNGARRPGDPQPLFQERVQREARRGRRETNILANNQRSEAHAREELLPSGSQGHQHAYQRGWRGKDHRLWFRL